MNILFVCDGSTGWSQIATSLFNAYSNGRGEARSVFSAHGSALPELLGWASRIIYVGAESSATEIGGVSDFESWQLPVERANTTLDPHEVREILKERVLMMLT